MLYHLTPEYYTRRKSCESIVIHCADTPPEMDVTAEMIRGWHIHERGWIDIGYHFVIRRDGTLELGRPFWAQGAGVAGWNADSVHICLAGGRKSGSTAPENNFTPAQWRTLRSLVSAIQEIDPGEEGVLGHRDYPGVTKSCPSFDVKPWWAAIQQEK